MPTIHSDLSLPRYLNSAPLPSLCTHGPAWDSSSGSLDGQSLLIVHVPALGSPPQRGLACVAHGDLPSLPRPITLPHITFLRAVTTADRIMLTYLLDASSNRL